MASTQSKPSLQIAESDPFDALLTLEDTLYTTAYTAGTTAGAHAGRIEGRVFGLEKGFEKFAALGELHGRSVVWGSRVLASSETLKNGVEVEVGKEVETENVEKKREGKTLPSLPKNQRLINNITLLHSLTDPLTFSTENTEEAVADFDDRVKRAGAKAKVIERIAGESEGGATAKSPDGSPARGKTRGVRLNEREKKSGKKGDDSMEDFAGSRLLR
ncbi:hypothetical protein CC86DRAFT_365591 [Ophiobolus disseminans]|uniref:Essential protein Yae1 N-terminal domain-containing protein n=1 Tax=Ophiobolus disseminans TaxID=1469910 RepID=A0A6A7AME1_9PLEO|nr:hypothetical protein CC86DRAFT_365591 [Ophiobolus disseminans]